MLPRGSGLFPATRNAANANAAPEKKNLPAAVAHDATAPTIVLHSVGMETLSQSLTGLRQWPFDRDPASSQGFTEVCLCHRHGTTHVEPI